MQVLLNDQTQSQRKIRTGHWSFGIFLACLLCNKAMENKDGWPIQSLTFYASFQMRLQSALILKWSPLLPATDFTADAVLLERPQHQRLHDLLSVKGIYLWGPQSATTHKGIWWTCASLGVWSLKTIDPWVLLHRVANRWTSGFTNKKEIRTLSIFK